MNRYVGKDARLAWKADFGGRAVERVGGNDCGLRWRERRGGRDVNTPADGCAHGGAFHPGSNADGGPYDAFHPGSNADGGPYAASHP